MTAKVHNHSEQFDGHTHPSAGAGPLLCTGISSRLRHRKIVAGTASATGSRTGSRAGTSSKQ